MRWLFGAFATLVAVLCFALPIRAQFMMTGVGPGVASTSTPQPTPSVVQVSPTCPAASSCAFGSAPTTGDKVVVHQAAGFNIQTQTVKDSASNSLTLETSPSGCGHCDWIYDETAPASITGTFTFSPNAPTEAIMYEVKNVVGTPNFAPTNVATSGTTLTVTIAGVTNHDVLICGGIESGVSTGNVTIASSNGTMTTDYADTSQAYGHAVATSTASTTFTLGNLVSASNVGLSCADYP